MYKDKDTIIGAIFGTGCNAAYMESRKNISKLNISDEEKSKYGTGGEDDLMAINCEYGAFDNSHTVLPRTIFDERVDEESPRPGEQTFEKMSAGLYLGEIFRQAILDIWKQGVLFKSEQRSDQGQTADDAEKRRRSIGEPYTIDTEFLSAIENDDSEELIESRKLFAAQLCLPGSESKTLCATSEELLLIRHLAQLIAIRGARLCACGVSAICQRLDTKSGHVAADGSVAIKHPHFRRRWEMAVAEVLDAEPGQIKLTSAEDGSGIGAAVITALRMAK